MAPEGISEYPAHDRLEPAHRTVDDISGFDCEAMTPDARSDVDRALQLQADRGLYQGLSRAVSSLAGKLQGAENRPPEFYDAQKLLLEAAGRLRDAAQRMEGNHE